MLKVHYIYTYSEAELGKTLSCEYSLKNITCYFNYTR